MDGVRKGTYDPKNGFIPDTDETSNRVCLACGYPVEDFAPWGCPHCGAGWEEIAEVEDGEGQ